MLNVSLPTPSLPPPPVSLRRPWETAPVPISACRSSRTSRCNVATGSQQTKSLNGLTQGPASWFASPTGAVSVKPMQPILPLVSPDVTAPGRSLRGVVFLGGAYQDTATRCR